MPIRLLCPETKDTNSRGTTTDRTRPGQFYPFEVKGTLVSYQLQRKSWISKNPRLLSATPCRDPLRLLQQDSTTDLCRWLLRIQSTPLIQFARRHHRLFPINRRTGVLDVPHGSRFPSTTRTTSPPLTRTIYHFPVCLMERKGIVSFQILLSGRGIK